MVGQIVELGYSRRSNILSVTSSEMINKMALLFAKTKFKNRQGLRQGRVGG